MNTSTYGNSAAKIVNPEPLERTVRPGGVVVREA
jgi:hypothetical protein